jgi:hypothetical protein
MRARDDDDLENDLRIYVWGVEKEEILDMCDKSV